MSDLKQIIRYTTLHADTILKERIKNLKAICFNTTLYQNVWLLNFYWLSQNYVSEYKVIYLIITAI